MQPTSLLRSLLFAVATSAAAGTPLAVQSKITAVTLYADRAVVTRSTSVEVPAGPAEVTFEKLPASLLDDSLQLTGRGAAQATLLDVTARAVYVDTTPNERVKALEDQLRAIAQEERGLADRAAVQGQQRDYVLKIQTATTTPPKETAAAIAPEMWVKLLTFSQDQLDKIAGELRAIDAQREELQARRTAVEQQLNELRGQGGRSTETVAVRLSAATSGRLELTLRYTVPGANWTPGYDARVSSRDHTLQLGYFGVVRQNTGEDWDQVELTLSTARPSLGGSAPELQPWIVQQAEIVPLQAQSAPPARMRMEAMDLARKELETDAKAREQTYAVAAATTQVETQATSATFRIPDRTDVPADNAPHKVAITTVPLQAEFTYQTTPKLRPAAFLNAEVTHTSDYPLLAGTMNVFLDDTFVASSRVRSVMPGEKFNLALGADEGIAVKRTLNNRFTEDTGLVTKSKRVTYDIVVSVQNNKKTAEKIVVQDQVPVSRHEKIVVKVIAPDARDVRPDAAGVLKWTLSLNPGEKRDLPLKFSIEYPVDLPVSGLE